MISLRWRTLLLMLVLAGLATWVDRSSAAPIFRTGTVLYGRPVGRCG